MERKYRYQDYGNDCVVFDYPTDSKIVVICVPSFKGGAFQFFLLRRKLKKLGLHVVTLDFSFRWFSRKMFTEMSLTRGKAELEFIVSKVKLLYPRKKIILFGQSFGGSICIRINQELVDGLILSSPVLNIEETLMSYFKFKNIKDISRGEYLYFWEPINFPIKLLRLRVKSVIIQDAIKNFDPYVLAEKIITPILIFRGRNDRRLGEKVVSKFFEKIKSKKKQLTVIDGGAHNALSFWFSRTLSDEIYLFLKKNFDVGSEL